MKKIAIGLLLLTAIAFAGWFALQPTHLLQTTYQPSDLLPEKTLLTVEMVDVKKNLEDFRTSRLGHNLAAIDFASVLREMDVPSRDIIAFEEAKTTILSNIDSPVFSELFGQETIIALQPLQKPLPPSPTPQYFLNSLVIISRPRHNADLLSFAAQWLNKDLAIEEEPYSHHTITRLKLQNGMDLYYTTLSDLLISSTNMEHIRHCLDLSEGEDISLSATAAYQKLQKDLRSAETALFSYTNTSALLEHFAALSEASALSQSEKSLQKDVTANLNGIHAIGSTFDINSPRRHTNRILCLVNRQDMAPVFRETFAIEPAPNRTLPMISSRPLIYYWTNTINLRAYMNHYIDNAYQRQQLENTIRQQLNMPADRLLEAFGGQWAMVLEDLSINGFIPVPKMALLAEVADQETVSSLLQTTFQRPNVRYLQESFQGTTIHSAQLPMGIALQPAYAFYNGFCILASHPGMIKQMMSPESNTARLTAAEAFQKINEGLTDHNNNIAFIQSDQLIEKLQSLMGWSSNMLAMQGKNGQKSRIMINQVINPILDGFKMYKAIGARTRFGEDTIEMLNVYQVDNEPRS